MPETKMDESRRGMLIGGLITLGVGTIFLLVNLEILPNIGDMWPLIPIIVGISLIAGAFSKGNNPDKSD